MKIQNINNFQTSSNSFTGKIRTRILLESLGGNIIDMNKNDKSLRLNGFSAITGIPKEKLENKLSEVESLRLFTDSLRNVLNKNYPKLAIAAEKYKDDLFLLLFKGKLGSKADFNRIGAKYDKTFGRYVDINIDEGEKRFFNRYIEMF